jgi:hypothetical protein
MIEFKRFVPLLIALFVTSCSFVTRENATVYPVRIYGDGQLVIAHSASNGFHGLYRSNPRWSLCHSMRRAVVRFSRVQLGALIFEESDDAWYVSGLRLGFIALPVVNSRFGYADLLGNLLLKQT